MRINCNFYYEIMRNKWFKLRIYEYYQQIVPGTIQLLMNSEVSTAFFFPVGCGSHTTFNQQHDYYLNS